MKNRDHMEEMLAKLFGSTSRPRILSLLLSHPQQTFYQREIMYETGLSLQTVQRELENLLGLGILKRRETRSLRAEAAQLGVRVSVLCPGVVRTPILEGGGKYGKMLIDIPPGQVRQLLEKLKPMSPNLFAKKVLRLVAKNKTIIIVPSWWKAFWWINRLSPSLGIFLSQKRFQKVQKKLGIEIKRA